MTDRPIDPMEFIAGVKVVDIGDIRVARGMARRSRSSCPHQQMVYDTKERRIWCEDCETTIDPFDAFEILVAWHSEAAKNLDRRNKRVNAAERHSLHLLAAKEIEKAWRSRTMLPCCPSCGNGLWPEDFRDGALSHVGREYAKARRKRERRQ